MLLRGEGLALREWDDDDLAAMCALFDEPAIDRWTPLESPFDRGAAARYLARARERRAEGHSLQLAITHDGGEPLGEVLLFNHVGDTAELGYAIGALHRGQGLAARAVRLLVADAAADMGVRRFLLRIPPGNGASQAVAAAAGFAVTAAPLESQEDKGRSLELATWERRA